MPQLSLAAGEEQDVLADCNSLCGHMLHPNGCSGCFPFGSSPFFELFHVSNVKTVVLGFWVTPYQLYANQGGKRGMQCILEPAAGMLYTREFQ